MTQPLETELAHMLRLMDSPTSFLGWRDYLEWKAKALAKKYPLEYEDLPRLLTAETRRLESSLLQSKQPEPDTP